MGGGCVNKAGIPGRGWLESDVFIVVMVVLVVLVEVNVAVGRFLGFCAFGNRTFRGFPTSGINGIWRYFVDLKFKEMSTFFFLTIVL